MANEIAVDPRVVLGKQNRRLREAGKVPAVVYGKGRESTAVEMDAKAFELLYRAAGRSSLVQLTVGDGRAESAIIKSVQRNPLTGRALHVDFFLVDLKATMEVEIPLTFTGTAPAIDAIGGTLLTNLSQVKVRALPGDLPHEITVDLSPLVDLDAAIHISDIVTAENVQVLGEPDELVAKVLPPRVEEEPVIEAVEEELAEGEAAPAEGEAAEAAAGAEGQGASETAEGSGEG
jgi:large subunit ribosomal protein L25